MTRSIKPLIPTRAIATFRRRCQTSTLKRGKVETVNLKEQFDVSTEQIAMGVLAVLIIGWAFIYAQYILPAFYQAHPKSYALNLLMLIPGLSPHGFISYLPMNMPYLVMDLMWGIQAALVTLVFLSLWPILKLTLSALFRWKRPQKENWMQYNIIWRGWIYIFLAFLLTCLFMQNQSSIIWHLLTPITDQKVADILQFNPLYFIGAYFCLLIILPCLMKLWLDDGMTFVNVDSDFKLYLGQSTGEFTDRSHQAGIAKGQNICLSAKDAAMNILVLGGIGEGKTTSAINPLLLQLLDQDCGGIIFDIKGNFYKTAQALAQTVGKQIVMVSPTEQKMNLIAGLTPEVAAMMLGAIIRKQSSGDKGDSFWVGQANMLCLGALGYLHFVPEHYNLSSLYQFIYDQDFREDIEGQLMAKELSDRDQKLYQSYKRQLASFDSSREDMKKDIQTTAGNVLNQFMHPDIQESYCSSTEQALNLKEVLDGKVFLINLPQGEYGDCRNTVYKFLKMRWFNVMNRRRDMPDWDQDRMVFFLCDEYQNLITPSPNSAMSDSTFWDKSRDTNAIGIVSAQSISSFYQTDSNRDSIDTVIQNFRQKIFLKLENDATTRYMESIIGKSLVENRSLSSQKSKSDRGNSRSSSSTSSSENISLRERNILDSQLIRSLKPYQAVACLSINQQSMDDVINLQPVFTEN
jgi:type IV secretory pathway TraG/TraD family ATPase VirD4